jgi:hypothetical protein
MIFHAAVNTIGAGFFFPMFNGADLNRLWWIYAALWGMFAILIILIPASGMSGKGLTAEDLNVAPLRKPNVVPVIQA